MSSIHTPYGPPVAKVASPTDEFQPVGLLSVCGRIGRARYIFYTSAMPLFLLLITTAVMISVHSLTMVTILPLIVLSVAMLIVFVMLTIQRSHDFGITGALAILGFVPLVNLLFWLVPGTDGRNRFGPPAPPTPRAVLIGACTVPIVILLIAAAATLVPSLDHR